MRKIIQTSCSELLVDTGIFDAKEAFKKFAKMFKELEWESSPPLSIELLESLKQGDPYSSRTDISIYDGKGNYAALQYGDNGYITTGYRFDSECNHVNENCFPIFKAAIEKLNGELISCDGGSTEYYKDWEKKQ